MSNAETPAENAGGTTATPAARALADLPDKTRVHQLAKVLGTSSREVLATLAQLGHTARSPQSGVAREVALRVAETLGATGAEQGGQPQDPTPEPATGAEPESQPEPEKSEQPPGQKKRARTRAERPARPADRQPEPTQEAGSAEPAESPGAAPVFAAPSPLFLPPDPVTKPTARPAAAKDEDGPGAPDQEADTTATTTNTADGDAGQDRSGEDDDGSDGGRRRRRRGRRGRGRGKGGDDTATDEQQGKQAEATQSATQGATQSDEKAARGEDDSGGQQEGQAAKDTSEQGGSGDSDSASKRRRRRRRRKNGDEDGADSTSSSDDPPNTVVHVRDGKQADEKAGEKAGKAEDGVRSVRGSTRLEAKRQRRRDGREAGRRRAPILSESEFLARRESVDRTMVVAERGDSTQIGVLEDGVLVEHFVTSAGSGSIVGNVYLGRVQNVLPSMEAAFIDIGRGRNAVLYAGEVDWDAAGLEGKARKIEQALSTGDHVLVQATKDPVGHKGARLTTQISLPGRFLVYVPSGGATGISRKLPENERRRLKDILKRIVPSDAGVIIRTASEGVSEDELDRDVRRLKAQWDVIKEKADSVGSKKSGAPALLYEEPDLLVKVVRDLFTEDFGKLEIQGATAWETIHSYVEHVAPDLVDRVKRYVGQGDVFADHRIDEQMTKALDRKVWLPSGGYLVIDRTEAMTVIDVNTGKFTGSGGNLEETVTRNNLESAEEIVRQLRLRDIGGIIVIDFIDMVLESNRELVLRRLTECLGRDRTRHQVAEVTSLGLVQMTRKRVGTGLLEAFSTTCEHCKGRGVLVSSEPQRGHGQNGHGGHNGHGGGGQGGGQGGQGGSRRARNKAKAAEQEAAKAAEAPAPTPEQRESAVSAVQAVANASKVTNKATDAEPEADRPSEDTPTRSRGRQRVTRDTSPPAKQRKRADAAPTEKREDAPTPPAPAAEPAPAESTPAAPVAPAAPAEPAAPAASAASAVSAESAAPVPATRTATRRPRRAASRPAGPPVSAQDNGVAGH
ncbi:ribonuclease E/G [Saccharomonospora piscinae]|uniref:Ribonuclease E n=1 Tax=Saccharomonospora piscinae TaxID=687388 RepID=A0A1V8ZX16_SACPI|nr:translation initiation factor IF-2 N-terminal domain-containing protein [Saccharomonospora piscinae]OQO89497.1 ribonuclease E/G [Saccharomonospora piscinae]